MFFNDSIYYNRLVSNSDSILSTSRKVFGDRIVMGVIRKTFFEHFCAGESEETIKPKIDYLASHHIGGILDYAAEADIAEDDEKEAAADEEKKKSGALEKTVFEARQYKYSTEQQCNANKDIFKKAITSVHNVTPDGFAAVKITGLCNPILLERWSTALIEIRNLFSRLDTNKDGTLSWEDFKSGWTSLFNETDEKVLRDLFNKYDVSKEGAIDPIEWTNNLLPEQMAQIAKGCKTQGPFFNAALNDEEVKLINAMQDRVDELANLADKLNVRIMIDAEHSYFQPAIDNIVLRLQRRHNVNGKALIFNTFQCYLKDSKAKVLEHIERSETENWQFAAKIVRGAYMVLERQRAKDMNYPSPIHDSIEDTHDNYNEVVKIVTNRSSVKEGRSKVNMLVASHNQRSVELAISEMTKAKIHPKEGGVYFGQLLGMSDHLTFTLGKCGYVAYKYVPYGPIHEVIPYLVRRAQENKGIMSGTGPERKMLTQELKRRIFGR
jgi:proline dehydrogenase